MPLSDAHKTAIDEVVDTLEKKSAGGRFKRYLINMFKELLDRDGWEDYYKVIPEPRAINPIKDKLAKNAYDDPLEVYKDLSLVFWNALYYNEEHSQIANDASVLKLLLDSEWSKRKDALPQPSRTSPPPTSPQKVHPVPEEKKKSRRETLAEQAALAAQQQQQQQQAASSSSSAPSGAPRTIQAPTPRKAAAAAPAVPEPASSDLGGEEGMSVDGGEDVVIMEQRDPESEQIVKSLERGLPRWQGFTEVGWWEYDGPKERFIEIVHAIKSHKDVINNRLSTALEQVPEEPSLPNLAYNGPISLKVIDTKARNNEYPTSQSFDLDMARLFDKARKYHEPQSEAYARVLLLQRLYHALTPHSPTVPVPQGPPYTSTTGFAGLRAGPGNCKPVHGESDGVAGVTSHRVLSRERQFVDEISYKGWTLRLADWVHLANPDDAGRPVIGQVFRLWVSEEAGKRGQKGITVSWYFRPEQTHHPATRQFWEGEIFKTSHFADHPIEDLLEKIACQFTARHIRGRPRPPYWWPGFPLYVCDSRYNDRDRIFVKIKNWNSCVPEEVRKSQEFMPIYPFERNVFPVRMSSPFVGSGARAKAVLGGKVPGGLIDAPNAAQMGNVDEADGYGGNRRRTKRNFGMGDVSGPTKGAYVGATAQQQGQAITAPAPGYHPGAMRWDARTKMYVLPEADPGTGIGLYGQQPQQVGQAAGIQQQQKVDRSIVTSLGQNAVYAQTERLPPETAKHFDRDPETNEVLWFSGAPMNVARVPAPRHSLEYLHFLAENKKRKRGEGAEDECEDGEDGERESEVEGEAEKKKAKTRMPLTLMEILANVEIPKGVPVKSS